MEVPVVDISTLLLGISKKALSALWYSLHITPDGARVALIGILAIAAVAVFLLAIRSRD